MTELPSVAKLPNEIPGLQIVGVSLDEPENAAKVRDAASKNGFSGRTAIDVGQNVAADYGISGIPFSVLVNPDGMIVMKAMRGSGKVNAIKEAMGL